MAQLRAPKHKNVLICFAAALCSALVAFGVLTVRVHPSFTVSSGDSSQEAASQEAVIDGEVQVEQKSSEQSESPNSAVIVHIDGAVVNPGVYSLQAGDRVQAAVEAAGGLSQEADTSTLNLAAKLTDGQKIHVPSVGEVDNSNANSSVTSNNEGSNQTTSGLVNINTATIDELDTLPGVGPSTAATIVQDRDTLGPFSSVDDLMRVTGIGEKKFAKLKDYICV